MTENGASHQMQDNGNEQPLGPLVRRSPRKIGLLVGGAMTLVAGVSCIANGLGSLLGGTTVFISSDTAAVNIAACGIIVLFLGTIAIAGGTTALFGKHVSLSLAGAAAGMMGGGLVGFWLGLASLLLFAFSDMDI